MVSAGRAERTLGPARSSADFAVRLASIVAGLFLFALGIACTLRSGLGLGPWDVLHQGITRHIPITFGQANIIVGVVIVVGGVILHVRPGLGTVLNMLLVGFFVDRILGARILPSPSSLPPRVVLDLAGILIVGLGSGLYIKANFGAGPRDSLMLGLHRLTGKRVSVVRACLESCVAASGFLLGGTVGIGTVLFALLVGPAVEVGFRLFGVPRVSPRQSHAAP